MKKQIVTMMPGGGNWWQMRLAHWGILAVLFLPIFAILCVLLLNPLWFRDDLLIWFENRINQLSVWRNRLLYRIYLGTDPEVWHTLKDS